MRKPITLWFTMILNPSGEWVRVGRPHRSKHVAASWLPFVRGAYRNCCRAKVSCCEIHFNQDGLPTEESIRRLSEQFNVEIELPQVAGARS